MKLIEKKRILVTVKAYPNPSKKYLETVCCAGVDLSNFQLIRLYPIPFRYLDNEQKFKKYSIIDVDCFPPSDDRRPESYRIVADSLKIVDVLDTEKGTWKKRKDIVLKVSIKSMCQVYDDAKERDVSLGLIKPENVTFQFTKHSLSDQKLKKVHHVQLCLFVKKKNTIEKIPFHFYYTFKCAGIDNCPGHKLPIIDWEIGQAFRDWRTKYLTEKVLLEKIEQKWLDISNTTKKDVFFYVGNMKRFRDTFMVLGVFYPKLDQ